MSDDDLSAKLFVRNMHAGAFPLLMEYHKKKEPGKITKEMVEEAKSAVASTKMMAEYCEKLLTKLSEAQKLDLPK